MMSKAEFAAIQGTGPAVRVDLAPATPYKQLLATVPDHHSSLERITDAVHRVRATTDRRLSSAQATAALRLR